MKELIAWLESLSVAELVALAALVLMQVGLQVFCVLDLFRRDKGPVKGAKLVWLLIVVFGELLGALLYLAVGRSMVGAVETTEQGAAPTSESAAAAVDALYGPRDGGAGGPQA